MVTYTLGECFMHLAMYLLKYYFISTYDCLLILENCHSLALIPHSANSDHEISSHTHSFVEIRLVCSSPGRRTHTHLLCRHAPLHAAPDGWVPEPPISTSVCSFSLGSCFIPGATGHRPQAMGCSFFKNFLEDYCFTMLC